ncbi:hypothetical protein IMSAGC007_01980 [Lachnospiraceae bacterium]|jgi:predicted SAM-dependent methyltransferase|nr:hypothetical protein IMSAGC007_01980 [Lachnospiraceae bacterium]
MEKVVLWGSGIVGGEAYNVLSKSYEIKAFGDNDIFKQNLFFKGIPVISVKELIEKYSDCKVIVSMFDYYEQAGKLANQSVSVLGYYDKEKKKVLPWQRITWESIVCKKNLYLYAGDIYSNFDKYPDAVCLSLTKHDYCSIQHDITKPYPINSESVDCYQIEDVLEHIEIEKVVQALNEIHRILKRGGYLRLSLPDYHAPILLDRSFLDCYGKPVYDPEGGGNFINGKVCGGGHMWFPTFELIQEILEKSAFNRFKFYRYHDAYGKIHSQEIDYKKGYISRTKENDVRKEDFSIVVDCYK